MKKDVVIIGAGPAGLSCAFYLAEKGYSPVIFEKNEKPGGMLRYGIPSFKLEKDVIDAEIDIIKAMGVEIKCGIEVGKDVTLDELRAQGYKAFYIAIGCQGGRLAGVPGEDGVCDLGDTDAYYGGGNELMHKAFAIDAEQTILVTNNAEYGYLASAYVAIPNTETTLDVHPTIKGHAYIANKLVNAIENP